MRNTTRRLLVLLAAVSLAASAYSVFEWDRARRPGYWRVDASVDASWTGPIGNGHMYASSKSVLKSLPSGFRPTDRTPFGNTLLIMAAWSGEPGLMRQAYAAGCKVTDVNRVGWTALHAAARYNRLEALKLLLQWGADPNCRTQSNDTPLKFAVWGARPEMVAELLNSGASPRVAGPLGTSLLAASAQQLEDSVWKVDRWRSFQGVPREDRLMLRRVIRTIALLIRAGAPTDDPHFEEALASVPVWLREETYQAIAADAALRVRVRVRSLRKARPVRGSGGA